MPSQPNLHSLLNRRRVKAAEITLLTQQIHSMLSVGISLSQALILIAQNQSNPILKALIQQMNSKLTAGQSLQKTLQAYPGYFNDFYCHLIGMGEQTGQLTHSLQQLVRHREKLAQIKRQITKALFYPCIIFVFAMITTLVTLIVIIPQFQQLFHSLNTDLPLLTRLIIATSNWLQRNGWMLVVLMSAIISGGYYGYRHSNRFRGMIDRGLLRIPIMGRLIRYTCVAQLSHALATTNAVGIAITRALPLAATIVHNQLYQRAINQINDHVQNGWSLHRSLQDTRLFPPMLLQMVLIGEQTGQLATLLTRSAGVYEQEIDSVVQRFSVLIEPILVLVLGSLIGGLVVAMYLPIFQLGNGL